jgi:hypothetical protein
VQDLSLGGICLRIERPLAEGERFELVLAGGPDPQACVLRGEVMWWQGGRAGLRWIDLTLSQERWLRQLFRGWRSEACSVRLGQDELAIRHFELIPVRASLSV